MPFRVFKTRRGTQENIIRDESAGKKAEGNNDVDTCGKHPQKPLEYFCLECDNIYCSVCIVTNVHKKSKQHTLKYIFEVADEFAESEEFTAYNKKIISLKTRLERSRHRIEENIKEHEQLKLATDNIIEHRKNNLIDLIDTHVQDILQQNDNKMNNSVSRLQKLDEQNSALVEELVQIENEISGKKGTRDVCPLFIAVLKSKDKVERIEEDIRKLSKLNHVTRYVFEANEQALTCMINKEDFGDLVEENLDSLEMKSPYDTDESQDTFDDDHNSTSLQRSQKGTHQRTDSMHILPSSIGHRVYPANLQPSPRKAFQRSYPTLSLPSSGRQLGDFTECWNRETPAYKISKPLSRSLIPEEEGYLKPHNSDTAVSMMEHGQCSYSEDSLNTLSARSGARPKRPPKPNPKPSAQVIKQAREMNNFLYGCQHHNFDRQTQDIPGRYKVVHRVVAPYENCLNCDEGDIVSVLERSETGWCWVDLNGQQGYILEYSLEKVVETRLDAIRNILEKNLQL